MPFERQREATQALDETFHGFLTRSTMGLSPIALALAAADWAMHLAASPGARWCWGTGAGVGPASHGHRRQPPYG